jgi:hypothetical protein
MAVGAVFGLSQCRNGTIGIASCVDTLVCAFECVLDVYVICLECMYGNTSPLYPADLSDLALVRVTLSVASLPRRPAAHHRIENVYYTSEKAIGTGAYSKVLFGKDRTGTCFGLGFWVQGSGCGFSFLGSEG